MTDSSFDSPENGTSRRDFLVLGALAGAALLLPSLPASAAFGYGDTRHLRFLEELQNLQADFFTKAALSATNDGLSEREMNIFNLIAKQDAEQARWFAKARQRYGIAAFDKSYTSNLSVSRVTPEYHYPRNTFQTRAEMFARAIEIKETAVGAFHGVVIRASDDKIVESVASLAGVQNRHLAALKELSGQNPLTAYVEATTPRAAANKLTAYKFKSEALD